MKKIKQTIDALVRFETANIENQEFAKSMEDYCIATKNGYFWGFCRKLQENITKKQVEKIST